MSKINIRNLSVAVLVVQLSACSITSVKPVEEGYSRIAQLPYYELKQWLFAGRIALSSKQDSWTANISWRHQSEQEHIKLAGPWGQGATLIDLNAQQVVVTRGNGDRQASVEPAEFIKQQLGVDVPLAALRYWVLGLPEPSQDFQENKSGFYQSGWLIEYPQMQAEKTNKMPRKITIIHSQVKIKLVIDQWNTDESIEY